MSIGAAKLNKPEAQYVLKFFDRSVKQSLKASAALNERSMNNEILYLIRRGQEAVMREKSGATT